MTDARSLVADVALGTDIGLVAKLMRGFADPTRLAILAALSDGELRVTDLVARVGGSQGNISGHLSCLKDCGMVTDRPEGRAVWYSIAEPEVVGVIRAAEGLLARTGTQVELCPNYRAPEGSGR
jgi:ArsR family transcriptional regulator, cadmium/lead-responsive transcriptional repressor